MTFYLTTGKTAFGSKRVSDKQVLYHALNTGVVFVHPDAIRDGTVHPNDFPAGVELVLTYTPPPDALILAPAPKGWVVK